MSPSNTTVVYGPPGTGKTTALVGMVAELLKNGVSLSNIGYTTFTRQGIKAATDRIIRTVKLSADKELVWFKTLHSMAFKMLNCNRSNIMTTVDYREVAFDCRIDISPDVGVRHLNDSPKLGDRIIQYERMARARQVDYVRVLAEAEEYDVTEEQIVRYAAALMAYKASSLKMDYQDMIDAYNKRGYIQPFHVLVVDEAQDLNPSQWTMVRKLATRAERIIIAGDDDQAIHVWAGADASHFIGLAGNKKYLTQSYRVPFLAAELAKKVIHTVKDRVQKEWQHRPGSEREEIKVLTELSWRCLDMTKGEWLLLTRTRGQAKSVTIQLMKRGYFPDSLFTPVEHAPRLAQAIKTWIDFAADKPVTAEALLNLWEFVGMKTLARGSRNGLLKSDPKKLFTFAVFHYTWGVIAERTTDLRYVFHRHAHVIKFIRTIEEMVRSKGDAVLPNVKVSTIHASKGTEAENVVLFTDVGRKVMLGNYFKQENELRLWYTGITRTKNTLYIVQNQSDYHVYDLLTKLLNTHAVLPPHAITGRTDFEDSSYGPPTPDLEGDVEPGVLRPFLGDGSGEE